MTMLRLLTSIALLSWSFDIVGATSPHPYLGCYLDSATRDFSVFEEDDRDNNSPEGCARKCEGFKYFGLQFSYQCFCSHTPPTTAIDEIARCDKSCPGDSQSPCGGSWANSVYLTENPGLLFDAVQYHDWAKDTAVNDLKVSLSHPPLEGKVVVSVLNHGYDQVLLSVCEIVFTMDNWEGVVVEMVLNQGFSTGGQQFTIDFEIESTTSAVYKSHPFKREYVVDPVSRGAGGTCITWGDPHFVTLDERKFDLYYVGPYYLFRDPDSRFVVQADQRKCGKVSCNAQIAIKFDDSVIIMSIPHDGERGTSSDVTLTRIGGDTSGFTVSKTDDRTWKYSMKDGSSVTIEPSYWGGIDTWYLNVELYAPSKYQNRVFGLCGNFDGNKANDVFSAPSVPEYIVPTDESLWNPSCVIPPLMGYPPETVPDPSVGLNPVDVTDFGTCNIDAPETPSNPPPEISIPPAVTPPEIPTFDEEYEPDPSCDPSQACLDACAPLTSGPFFDACSVFVDDLSQFGDDCLFDCCMGGTTTAEEAQLVADSSMGPPAAVCKAECEAKDPATCPPILGLECPEGCNGHGTCDQGVCICDEGFVGETCIPELYKKASIGGKVYVDYNANRDREAGEDLLADVIITLEKPDGSTVTQTTSPDGSYLFPDLTPGNYKVTIAETSGQASDFLWNPNLQVYPGTFTLPEFTDIHDADFMLYPTENIWGICTVGEDVYKCHQGNGKCWMFASERRGWDVAEANSCTPEYPKYVTTPEGEWSTTPAGIVLKSPNRHKYSWTWECECHDEL